MLAALVLEFQKTPSEIRALSRQERAFMVAALQWRSKQ